MAEKLEGNGTAARAFMCQHKRGSESDKGGALGLIIRIHFQAS